MLAANSDHTNQVSATGTNGDSTVVSGSAPTVDFELCPDIVWLIVRLIAPPETVSCGTLLVVVTAIYEQTVC